MTKRPASNSFEAAHGSVRMLVREFAIPAAARVCPKRISNGCLCFRKDVRLPVQLQRAMATEAEAAREARAKVIAAEGEMRASHSLKEAGDVISTSPAALQVRAPARVSYLALPSPLPFRYPARHDVNYRSIHATV